MFYKDQILLKHLFNKVSLKSKTHLIEDPYNRECTKWRYMYLYYGYLKSPFSWSTSIGKCRKHKNHVFEWGFPLKPSVMWSLNSIMNSVKYRNARLSLQVGKPQKPPNFQSVNRVIVANRKCKFIVSPEILVHPKDRRVIFATFPLI